MGCVGRRHRDDEIVRALGPKDCLKKLEDSNSAVITIVLVVVLANTVFNLDRQLFHCQPQGRGDHNRGMTP